MAKQEYTEGQIPLGEPGVNLEVHSTAYVLCVFLVCGGGGCVCVWCVCVWCVCVVYVCVVCVCVCVCAVSVLPLSSIAAVLKALKLLPRKVT